MKCPNCGYEHNHPTDTVDGLKYPDGEEGEFYKMPEEMWRSHPTYGTMMNRSIHGCPKCGNVFINL